MDHRRRFSAFVARGAQCGPVIIAANSFARECAATLIPGAKGQRRRTKLQVIVEELVSNTLRHGSDGRDIALSLDIAPGADGVELALTHDGAPFNPAEHASFAGPHPKSGGGVGLAIVQAWSEDLTYSYTDRRNRIGVTIR